MEFGPVRLEDFPEPPAQAVRRQLEADEWIAAILRLDLDGQLSFADRFIVLTDRRLLIVGAGSTENSAESAFVVDSFPLREIVGLTIHDRGGLGNLEVLGRDRRLAIAHFTLGQAAPARDFVAAFDELQQGTYKRRLVATKPDQALSEVPEPEERPIAAHVGSLFRLFRFARQRVGIIALGSVLTLATTAFGLVAPGLLWPLTDEILAPYGELVKDVKEQFKKGQIDEATERAKLAEVRAEWRDRFVQDVPWYLGAMVGAALLTWVLGWAQGWVLAWLGERISADLRKTTYDHLLKLSLDFFSAKRTGDLVARISSDTDRICLFLSDSLMDFVTDVLMIAGSLAVLFWMNFWLALATICTFPFIAGLTFWIRDSLQRGFLYGGRAWAEMTSILADTIPGIRVVKAFAQERRENERFKSANDRIMAANDRVNKVWTFFWPMVALLTQTGLLVVWTMAAWQIYNQTVTMGMVWAAIMYVSRFYTRMESMSRMSTTAQRAAASAQRLFEVLDRVPSVPEPARPVSIGKVRGEIQIRNVNFRYGNRQVIDDVSLAIEPGEMIGLVGTTGAGKSTLVNLVCRFYDVSEGAIVVDGVDVRSFRVADYRQNIGIVLQDPFLFYGTIAENIAYGRPHSTREEIIAAARAARAHEFILQLPDGYDSIVGERGQTLSGGERQRISIARALLIDPRILILDEATSSVDTQTERQIQEALDNLVRGRTTIAIAHRLSTLRKADRLVVLERGRIVEIGNHSELLAARGTYSKLYHAQMQLAQDFHSPVTEPEPAVPVGPLEHEGRE